MFNSFLQALLLIPSEPLLSNISAAKRIECEENFYCLRRPQVPVLPGWWVPGGGGAGTAAVGSVQGLFPCSTSCV